MNKQAGPPANHKSLYWISVLALFTAAFANAARVGASGAIKAELFDPHDAALSAELMAGKASLATPGLLPKLRATMLAKLANDSPKYASLAAAKARWLKG